MSRIPSIYPSATEAALRAVPSPVLASSKFPFRTEVLPTWPIGTEPLYADVRLGVDMINPSDPTAYRSSADDQWGDWVDEIWEWTTHPDERIALAMANTRSISLPYGVLEVIAERALTTARREHAVWTPVLDAILVRASPDRSMKAGQMALNEPWNRVLWRQFTKMEMWVRAAPDYRAALPLLAFPSYAVHDMILQYARHLPAEWIAYSSEQHPKLLLDRRKIASLSPDTAQAVFELTLARAHRCEGDEFYEALCALEELKHHHVLSIKDCSGLEGLLVKGSVADETMSYHIGFLLRCHMVAALTAAPRTAHVHYVDLLCLLQSPCDALRRATQEFVSEMESQPT